MKTQIKAVKLGTSLPLDGVPHAICHLFKKVHITSHQQGWTWIVTLKKIGPTFSSFNVIPEKTTEKRLWLNTP